MHSCKRTDYTSIPFHGTRYVSDRYRRKNKDVRRFSVEIELPRDECVSCLLQVCLYTVRTDILRLRCPTLHQLGLCILGHLNQVPRTKYWSQHGSHHTHHPPGPNRPSCHSYSLQAYMEGPHEVRSKHRLSSR